MTALVSDKIDLKTNFKQISKSFRKDESDQSIGRHNNYHVYAPNGKASKYVKERKRQFHGPNWGI